MLASAQMNDHRAKGSEAGGLWRALEEDARCALIICASEGRSLDPESITKTVMRTYRSLPQAPQIGEKLRARVAEMIHHRRMARAS